MLTICHAEGICIKVARLEEACFAPVHLWVPFMPPPGRPAPSQGGKNIYIPGSQVIPEVWTPKQKQNQQTRKQMWLLRIVQSHRSRPARWRPRPPAPSPGPSPLLQGLWNNTQMIISVENVKPFLPKVCILWDGDCVFLIIDTLAHWRPLSSQSALYNNTNT